MIDQNYFEEQFETELQAGQGSSAVRLHLFDGTSVELFRITSTHPGYFFVQAYPLDESDAISDDELSLTNGHRLASLTRPSNMWS